MKRSYIRKSRSKTQKRYNSRRKSNRKTRKTKKVRKSRSRRQQQSRFIGFFKKKTPAFNDAEMGKMMDMIDQQCPICKVGPGTQNCMACRQQAKQSKPYRMLFGNSDPDTLRSQQGTQLKSSFSWRRGPSPQEMEDKRRMETNRMICGANVACVRNLNDKRLRGTLESDLLMQHFNRN